MFTETDISSSDWIVFNYVQLGTKKFYFIQFFQ